MMESQKEAFVLKLRKMKEDAKLKREEKEKRVKRKEAQRIKRIEKQSQKQSEELENRNSIEYPEPDVQENELAIQTQAEPGVPNKRYERNQPQRLSKAPRKKNPKVSDTAMKKRRQKEVEKKRKQFEKLKENPEKYNIWKQKDRERYKVKKSQGKLKLINDMKPREQKIQRKKWAEKKRKQRQQKAEQLRMNQFAAINSPPESPLLENAPPRVKSVPTSSEKKKKMIKTSVYRKLYAAEIALKKANTRAARYKKRAQRAAVNSQLGNLSPKKRVNQLMQGKTAAIKKRLLFGETIISQLKGTFKSCTEMEKRRLASAIGTKILRKYRLLSLTTQFMSDRMKRFADSGRSVKRHSAGKSVSKQTVKSVVKFLEEDCNSTLAPGMKDTTTYRKNKQRKRYVRDTLKNLHTKYNKEHPDTKICYSTFCKVKPFWIMKPKVTARETCVCIKHANFQYIIDKMHFLKLTNIKQCTTLSEIVCCNKFQKSCMERKCRRCQSKKIPETVNDVGKNTRTFYYCWLTKRENRIINGKEKIVKFVSKEKVYCTVKELCKKAQEELPSFLSHEFNDYHQFKVFKDLRATLCENELIVLIDFSENFLCKYYSAIQSAHFGAAQVQVTLHTGVIYYKCSNSNNDDDNEGSKKQCMSFCTVSESLRHDSSAVWAHLQPILKKIKEEFVNVDTIHFKSDGPTTQYRNKSNLFLMTHFAKVYKFREVSWNFSESGHGIAAAGGVGGAIKKTADDAIAHGTDIANADALLDVLKSKNLKIEIFQVQEEEIREVDAIVQQRKPVMPIPNTMKLHQISWSSFNPDRLSLRLLSCFSCGADVCSHYASNPSTWNINNFFAKKQSAVMLKAVAHTSNSKITCKLDTCKLDLTSQKLQKQLEPGNWVVAIYDDSWYPGAVETVVDEKLIVNFMARCGKTANCFKWPINSDIQFLTPTGILCKCDPPTPISADKFKLENFHKISKIFDEVNGFKY